MKHSHFRKWLILGITVLLLMATAIPAIGASTKTRVFVEFAPTGKAAVRNALQQAGAEFHYTFDELNAFVVTVPAQALNGLSQNPNVVEIEEDAPRYPIRATAASSVLAPLADSLDSDGDKVPYGVDSVQARDVWDADRDGLFDSGAPVGQNVKVCVIDSGYYAAHEDLAGVSHAGTAQLDAPYTTDGYGHGTHVAGTIAAQNNGMGVIGVAPGVSFYIVKFFGDDGLATFSSDLIAASNDCANAGARIISMSLGGSSSNRREERAFNTHYQNGILSVAAAGNDGTTGFSYPASYSSVVSVAAIDEFNLVADFSQKNSQVELAAPGVGVLSTLPYIDNTSLSVGSVDYAANHIEFSARGTASGALVDGGLCTSTGAWTGKVVLCERGEISFYDKVMNVQNSGGAAAVIYNNVSGGFLGTLGDGNSSTIIGLSISQEDGQFLVDNKLGSSASVSSEFIQPASGYQAWNGTSMATPHVSAVAALLWSAFPNATNVEIRDAMTTTAFDLGAAGRDTSYGYGLVQAKSALTSLGGGTPSNTAPTVAITAPDDGTTVNEGTAITFVGTASDTEDGDLNEDISWTSSLNGSLGTGSSVTATLSAGTHTITASVTDSGGSTATDTITVTVNGGGTGTGSLFVTVATDKASYTKNQTATITVSVVDQNAAAVAGASVTTTITTGNGNVYVGSGTTNTAGQAFFSLRINPNKDGTGTYYVDATASLTGYDDGTGSTTFTVQ